MSTISLIFCDSLRDMWDQVFKSGQSKFFKGSLPQNLLSINLDHSYHKVKLMKD